MALARCRLWSSGKDFSWCMAPAPTTTHSLDKTQFTKQQDGHTYKSEWDAGGTSHAFTATSSIKVSLNIRYPVQHLLAILRRLHHLCFHNGHWKSRLKCER